MYMPLIKDGPFKHVVYGVLYGLRNNYFNSPSPEQSVRHYAGEILKCIFTNGNLFFISIQIPLQFVSNDPINDKPLLIQVTAWYRRPGNKPLPEARLIQFTDACMRH